MLRHMVMTQRLCVAVTFAVLNVGLAGCSSESSNDPAAQVPTEMHQSDRADLTSALSRWSQQGVTDYTMNLTTRCFCPGSGTYRVIVQQGRPTTVEALDEHNSGLPPEAYVGLDVAELLALADDPKWEQVQAEYDPVYGFPRSLELDQSLTAVDDELSYYIEDFSPTA